MRVKIRMATAKEKGTTKDTVYFVETSGQVVGLIMKAKNTRTDIHPYKVFRREDGATPNTLLESFYTDTDSVKIGAAFDYDKCKIGGKTAAFLYAARTFSV